MTDWQMRKQELIESVAFCGLICKLCYRTALCDGCRENATKCEQDRYNAGCFQRNCCIQSNYEGCWECEDLSQCFEGIYQLGEMSKVKAFATCIQEDGMEQFISYIVKNMEKGLSVEKGKDYDNLLISDVIKLLRTENFKQR